MLWYPVAEREAYVPITYTQVGQAPGLEILLATQGTVTIARWRQLPTGHVVTFYPGGALQAAQPGKTRFSLNDSGVTLDLLGQTRWTHTFVPGHTQASIMHDGGRIVPVVVHTTRAEALTQHAHGRIQLGFTLAHGDDQYPISMEIMFGVPPSGTGIR